MPTWFRIFLSSWYSRVGLVVVGRRVGEVHVPVAVDGDPVVRPGQVLGGQPEVDGVLGDLGQAEAAGPAW